VQPIQCARAVRIPSPETASASPFVARVHLGVDPALVGFFVSLLLTTGEDSIELRGLRL